MSVKQYSYENEVIRVSFDGSKCAHAGYCFRELHDVFDGDRDPPIDLNGGITEEIVRVVELCPSSALTYQRMGGGTNEAPIEEAAATLIPNGPLALRGKLKIDNQSYTRLTLCRCGKSNQKPFCDGSHHRCKFDDGKTIELEDASAKHKAESVTFSPSPDGPVMFSGAITFMLKDGQNICFREKGAICRCGASKSKPFCDGSHLAIDFKTI